MRPGIKPHVDPPLVCQALSRPRTAVVVHRFMKHLWAQILKPGHEECLEAVAAFDGAAPWLVRPLHTGDANPGGGRGWEII